MGRGDLTDAQWRRLEPHLPPEKPWTGHPNAPHRRIIDGILRILRTGAPWRDLPARYGPVGTVSSRFYRWRASGVWDRISRRRSRLGRRHPAGSTGICTTWMRLSSAPISTPPAPAETALS